MSAEQADRPVRVLLVDGLNLVRRVYAAQPGEDGPERAEEARLASVQSLQRALKESSPTHAVVVFEGGGPTWRHRLFAGYKAGHKPMPEVLRQSLPRFKGAFAQLGVESLEVEGVEADDVVATLATKTEAAGGAVVILSTDKAFLQLLSARVSVRDHFKKADLDRGHVLRRFGVPPESLVDLLALAGDNGNGIAGVAGVGAKTAARLLADFDTLDHLLAAVAGEGSSPSTAGMSDRLRGKLVGQADSARLAQRLVRLDGGLDLGLSLRALRYRPQAPKSERPAARAGVP